MRILTAFYGRNRVFREWLAAGMPENVVLIEEYREKKKTARKRPTDKKNNIVSLIVPKGTA